MEEVNELCYAFYSIGFSLNWFLILAHRINGVYSYHYSVTFLANNFSNMKSLKWKIYAPPIFLEMRERNKQ